MAGTVLIGSIPEIQVVEFRAGERERLEASRVVRCSDILPWWVTVAPLNLVLPETIYGGQFGRTDLWHPKRLPVFHGRTAVRQLHQQLIDALDQAVQEKGTPTADDWYAVEIGKVVEIFSHAASRGEAIVRVLDSPQDEERIRMVSIPICEVPI